jgi:hypothetical protein
MGVTRRLAFSTPFVVIVSCGSPAKPPPAPPPLRPEPVPIDAPVAVHQPYVPAELVDELPPMQPAPPPYVVCRGCTSNPPHPQKPDTVEPVLRSIVRMKPEGAGFRIRFRRSDGIDSSWRAVFQQRSEDADVPDGDCRIVDVGYGEVDCVTQLPLAEIIEGERLRMLRVTPPRALVEKIERIRAAWPPPPDWDPRKPWPPDVAVDNPPTPVVARVIARKVEGVDTVVVLGVGSNRGVTQGWRAVLVTDDGKPRPNGACSLFRIDRDTSSCKVHLTLEQVTSRAKLEPP